MVLSGLLQLVNLLAFSRRLGELERQACQRQAMADPVRTAELERALGMDLDGLPPFWRTVIRLYREMTRHA
jgi:hypothetical protein